MSYQAPRDGEQSPEITEHIGNEVLQLETKDETNA